jgi:hypothetical protein
MVEQTKVFKWRKIMNSPLKILQFYIQLNENIKTLTFELYTK